MVIPPSNLLIVYALAGGGTSDRCALHGRLHPGHPLGRRLHGRRLVLRPEAPELRAPVGPARELGRTFVQALPSLSLVVVVIGGIIAGFFTATEASAIAVVYALLLGFLYRAIKIKDLPHILYAAARPAPW